MGYGREMSVRPLERKYLEKMAQYKVSIVTAVYNVEEFLEEMVESIVAQTIGFRNIQLILVNDGSDDRSGEICDGYQQRYPDNVTAIHKENGGVSSARNVGLKHVKGEYINFTDADDMLEENAIEEMYNYLKENEEWIDVAVIPMQFFGTSNGGHPLNYKFQTTRIIDLRKEYNCIHLQLGSALIKKTCFDNRHFDAMLSYAEDAQLMVDILLDKMCYGAVCETSYRYRKRKAGGSALDTGRNKPGYYIPYMERFILHSLKNALSKKGYIPQFVQYTCMYDLQWRFIKHPCVNTGVLTVEEEKKYKLFLAEAVQYIDNHIILEQKNIGNNYKMAILSLKEKNKGKEELVFYPEDLKICIEDILSAYASSYTMVYEFIKISHEEIILEGHARFFAGLEDIEIILMADDGGCDGTVYTEYKAATFEREENYTFFMDKVITKAKGFRFNINRVGMPKNIVLYLYLRYRGHNILCKNIVFGKFFPLSKQLRKSFLYENGLFLVYAQNALSLTQPIGKGAVWRREMQFQKEILSKRSRKDLEGWAARNICHLLKLFKKKEIWLISDRLSKADDNGEAFFTYMNTIGKNRSIKTYFVLEKNSEDYNRLHKVGRVIPFHSIKHKIISLLCDKIISSQGEDYIFNRFFGWQYLFKDIQHRQKFIFLQHGITKDDLSRWLRKENKNISIFVTATNMEYQSILDYPYHYDKKQVKCTGFPRYDYLNDNSEGKKLITFMPTWRSYLVGDFDVGTGLRILKKGFESSSYCKMYCQVFSNSKLYEAAKNYGYTIRLMLHPAMPEECIEYFHCNSGMEILGKDTRYRDIFADSKLVLTDYSSVVFDFAYLRKPVIYYHADYDEFFSGSHTYDKGYFDYEKNGFGEVEYTAEALVDRIIEYMQNDCVLKEKYRKRIDGTFPYNDKENCRRVYEEIMKNAY